MPVHTGIRPFVCKVRVLRSLGVSRIDSSSVFRSAGKVFDKHRLSAAIK